MTIFVDSHEPPALSAAIRQAHPCQIENLNQLGFADILWHGAGDSTHQMERKKAPEALANLEDVTEQLRRQIATGVTDTLQLVIEGMIAPTAEGCACYEMSKEGKVMYRTRTSRRSYQSVMGWVSRLEEAGVQVFWVASTYATAMLVSVLYRHAQEETEEGYTTFSKYIKPKPVIQAYNPYVLTLMGVEGGGCGEETSKALVARWATPWNVFLQSATDLANTPLLGKADKPSTRRMGPAAAGKLIKAIGRPI